MFDKLIVAMKEFPINEFNNHSDVLLKAQLRKKTDSFQRRIGTFYSMEGANDLCALLHMSYDALSKIINEPVYTQSMLAKKRGGKRLIEAPSFELKKIQKILNKYLQIAYRDFKPEGVFGFVIGDKKSSGESNIVLNAVPHIAKKHLLNVDLTDFFNTIQAFRIKAVFKANPFKFSDHLATVLALLTTFKGHLPQGAPTSPVLSNFACYDLDVSIQSYCKQHGIHYTRYADDLTFSADFPLEKDFETLSSFIGAFGFQLNHQKIRWRNNSSKQTVTGITVNSKLNNDRQKLRQIRAMLHDLSLNGIDKATMNHFKLKRNSEVYERAKFLNKLNGNINFIGQVRGKEDVMFLKMKEKIGHYSHEI